MRRLVARLARRSQFAELVGRPVTLWSPRGIVAATVTRTRARTLVVRADGPVPLLTRGAVVLMDVSDLRGDFSIRNIHVIVRADRLFAPRGRVIVVQVHPAAVDVLRVSLAESSPTGGGVG